MAYIIQTVTEQLSSNDLYNDVKLFFKSNEPGTGEPVSHKYHRTVPEYKVAKIDILELISDKLGPQIK